MKPHASPIFHAIQYLLGRQDRARLENFRGFKGAQSYPSRTKDADDVDFSTGSVGLGVAQTLFASLVQDYVKAHGWAKDLPEGRKVRLVGEGLRYMDHTSAETMSDWVRREARAGRPMEVRQPKAWRHPRLGPIFARLSAETA